uniref:Uncharacterized protein n=1 Tax=Cacopsylla melanoneura TaxID=428564 RepID=A0A8D9E8P6_9HEMI
MVISLFYVSCVYHDKHVGLITEFRFRNSGYRGFRLCSVKKVLPTCCYLDGLTLLSGNKTQYTKYPDKSETQDWLLMKYVHKILRIKITQILNPRKSKTLC